MGAGAEGGPGLRRIYGSYGVYGRPAALEKLREEGMEELYRTVELPLIYALYHMEEEGILVRREELPCLRSALKGEDTCPGAGNLGDDRESSLISIRPSSWERSCLTR